MDPHRLVLIRSGTTRLPRRIGSGYLVAPRLVLTAGHVLRDDESGACWEQIQVSVGHPGLGETLRTGAKLIWSHPQDLDVALLLTHDEVDVPGSVRWGHPVESAPLRYEGLGFPMASGEDGRDAEHLRGVLPPLSCGVRGLYVLDQEHSPDRRDDGRKAWAGASGTAVFCEDHLVGVVIHDDLSYGNRRLRALPAHRFVREQGFEAILRRYSGGPPHITEMGAVLPTARPEGERSSAERETERLLWSVLGGRSSYAVHARALVRRLGYDAPNSHEPSMSDFAALVASHPRALPTLSSTLASALTGDDERARLTDVLTRARAGGLCLLLALDECERLLDLLGGICKKHPALIPRAAREALRYAWLPDTLSRPHLRADDLEPVVEHLESLSDSEPVPECTPPVPALLRLVECVAAALGREAGAELRAWSDQVATRTGIHPAALAERRTDAGRWAARQSSPLARVIVDLSRASTAPHESYHCRILLTRADGTHTSLHDAESAPRTSEEVARRIREAVEIVADELGSTATPHATVLLARDSLHLPVDEWNPGAPNEFVPDQPIGAEFCVTLSCPEMSDLVKSREREHRRRWEGGHTAAALVVDDERVTRPRLRRLLQTTHRDANRVVLHGPPEQRDALLELCLALGVPVVLWDRDAECSADAAALHPLDPTGPLADLPERVRVFRATAFDEPETLQARPALVWEGHQPPPRPASLILQDPPEGDNAS
ncbi:trypsin-like serine protease [Streptomyces sp. NPDC048002]|uniref:VMAP-C domain-containing protein n=1 Tax=Streptomyces sp. NPDC048002 TaxID=3154344 RepID=UPI0033DDC462